MTDPDNRESGRQSQRGLFRRILRHRIVLTFVILALLALVAARRWRSISADAESYQIEHFSLGFDGTRPSYQLPEDFALMQELERSGSSAALQLAWSLYYERWRQHYSIGRLSAQGIRVSEDQLPIVHTMVADACYLLGVDDPPNVFIVREPGEQITVTNFREPTIVIGSSFLWAYSSEELHFLISRAVAHIRCEHVFMLDMIQGIKAILDRALPDAVANYLVSGLLMQYMEWHKWAEMSADRGALTVTGDIPVALGALMKLNIGASFEDHLGSLDPSAYARQIERVDEAAVGSMAATVAEIANPNPFLTLRVKELMRFAEANARMFK